MEGGRHRHRQRADQALGHHHGVARELEPARAEDRAGRLFGASHVAHGCEERHLVVQVDELLAVVHGLEHDVPIGLAFLHVGQEARHVARGVGGGAGRFEIGPVARGLWVEHMHAERDHEGAGVLQGGLVEVADQGAHVPQREARREGTHGQQAKFAAFGLGRVAELDAGLADEEPRRSVDHLIAQLPAGVVGQWQALAALAVRIDESGDPVDELARRPGARRKTRCVQGGAVPVAQQQQLFDSTQVLRAARQRDTGDQPEIAEQVALVGQQRLARACQVMPDAAARHGAVDVAVAAGTSEFVQLGDDLIRQSQVRVAA